jgi:hydrophobe/amphiphile efflux-1 (HAE1) family protein
MRISHFFIERPAFAVVIAVLITLVGAIAYPGLPLAQYPQIVPPTVSVSASYPGASAELLADAVAGPIEQQINGVDGMDYISSSATGDGRLTITVTFKLGVDVDKAQQLVENRVAAAQPGLPDTVRQIGVVVRKSTPDTLLAVHLYSPDGSLDQQYIANYAVIHIRDRLLRIPGVGDIGSRASRDYAMRIWIDPDKAAARNLTTDEIITALRTHNLQTGGGVIGAAPFAGSAGAFQMTVDAQGRLDKPEQYADIIIKRDAAGHVTRVRDVARVELGAQDYTVNAYMSGYPAAAQGIQSQPNANALETADRILATMRELKKDFPPGLDYKIIYNPTEYVRASIDEVQKTLLIALVLVVIVVMLFLQSWRAALIPIMAIPVSLVGSFAVMAAFGFSLNNLSLFGLVLAIGIVVDDAIVVVENVERHLRDGLTPREAAHKTMDEVGGALVAIALVLVAVFVPTAFLSGISGQFYRQFALTIATATMISLIVSMTLSPTMAALLMRPHTDAPPRGLLGRLGSAYTDRFNSGFAGLNGFYSAFTRRTVRAGAIMLILYAGLLGVTAWRITATPTGFIPIQDQGNYLVAVQLPQGASLARSDTIVRDLVGRILKVPGIKAASVYVGTDPVTQANVSSAGQMYVILDSFEKRAAEHRSPDSILAELKKAVAPVAGADVRVLPPPPVRGIGSAGGFKMVIQDQSGAGPRALEQVANTVAEEAKKQPAIGNAFTTFNTRTPRIAADIDRDKAEMLGVQTQAVLSTLQTYLGSSFVNTFNLFGKTYQVQAQAEYPYRRDEADIATLQTRSSSGAMTPLGAVMSVRHTTGPYRVLRYNLFPGAEIQGDTAPGYSTGEALQAMEEAAQRVMPAGFSYEWTELAYQQKLAGNTGGLVFVLAVVFVFLLLTALYESVTLPLAVILIVPMCLLAAFTGVNLMGLDNNILTQIGLVVLIGLAAKNAILIVEFARQAEEEQGMSRWDAAIEAARTRLRPILMTSVAFVLGVAPLAFASGAGAEMRRALGVAVFFGMIGVTFFGLVFTPLFYVLCRRLSEFIPQPGSRKARSTPTQGDAP